MKKLWETYLMNSPYFSIGDIFCLIFLQSLIVLELVAWKVILFYLLFYFLYHVIRSFLKAAYFDDNI